MRYVFLIVLVLYGMILSCLLCSHNGLGIFHGCITLLCYKGWNRRLAQQILERDPRRANMLLRNYWRRRRILLERQYRQLLANRNAEVEIVEGEVLPVARQIDTFDEEIEEIEERQRPTHLALRTTRFRRNTTKLDDNEEQEDEDSCTICFAPLLDRERVGALECGHVFHVDCLKTWLSRRNACPLCAKTAAQERFEDETAPTEESATEGEESSNDPSNHIIGDAAVTVAATRTATATSDDANQI